MLFAFAAFNILLSRTIFSWVERWLAQRRTREIFGILLFFITLSFQFIGPAIERFSHRPAPGLIHDAEKLSVFQRALPPGLAAASIAFLMTVAPLACLLSSVALNSRAKRGRFENVAMTIGYAYPASMVMPVAALFILRVGRWHAGSQALPSVMLQPKDFGFPVGAAYSLLMLTNLVYNNFGGEGMGVQFYLVSPIRFREIVLGKNLAHGLYLATSLVLVWLSVNLVYGPPALAMTVMTLSALLFAAPVNFAGGNLFSLYSPKRVDYGTFGRQKASQLTVLASLGIQIVIVALGAGTVLVSRIYGNLWLATPIFLFLAVLGIAGYLLVLGRVDKIALKQRETLVTELGKS